MRTFRGFTAVDPTTFISYPGNGRKDLKVMRRDPCWVKARIAARILLRQRTGRVSSRDAQLAHRLADDPGVTDRLIDQALACLCAERQDVNYHDILRSTLATTA